MNRHTYPLPAPLLFLLDSVLIFYRINTYDYQAIIMAVAEAGIGDRTPCAGTVARPGDAGHPRFAGRVVAAAEGDRRGTRDIRHKLMTLEANNDDTKKRITTHCSLIIILFENPLSFIHNTQSSANTHVLH